MRVVKMTHTFQCDIQWGGREEVGLNTVSLHGYTLLYIDTGVI